MVRPALTLFRCSVLYDVCHSDFLTFVPIETIIISIISVQIKFLLVVKDVFHAYLYRVFHKEGPKIMAFIYLSLSAIDSQFRLSAEKCI